MKVKYRVKEVCVITIPKKHYGFLVYFNDKQTPDAERYQQVEDKLVKLYGASRLSVSRTEAVGLGMQFNSSGTSMVWSSKSGELPTDWTIVPVDLFLSRPVVVKRE